VATDISSEDRLLSPLRAVLVNTLHAAGYPAGEQISDGPMIDRDGVFAASIYVDNSNPAILNRSSEQLSGGRNMSSWRDPQNRRVSRLLRSRLVLSYLVEFSTPKLSRSVDILLNFVARLPRDCRDAHLYTDYDEANTPPPDRVDLALQGNVFELTPIQPIFPIIRTNTQRSYKASLVVRFDGGIYDDRVDRVSVRVAIRPPMIES